LVSTHFQPIHLFFSFRITPDMRERLIAAVKQSGRSLSEEVEFRLNRDLNWEQTKGDIHQMFAEATAIRSAAHVQALRAAGLMILRDIEGRPTRVVVDLETLLAEADGIARGLRSGFFAGESPPALEPPPPMTNEEAQRALEEIRRTIDEAVEKTRAADAAAAGSKDDDEAA
jgi:TraY domain